MFFRGEVGFFEPIFPSIVASDFEFNQVVLTRYPSLIIHYTTEAVRGKENEVWLRL